LAINVEYDPAENGTTRVTGFVGQLAKQPIDASANSMLTRIFFIVIFCLLI
jgi:hypothetical protein